MRIKLMHPSPCRLYNLEWGAYLLPNLPQDEAQAAARLAVKLGGDGGSRVSLVCFLGPRLSSGHMPMQYVPAVTHCRKPGCQLPTHLARAGVPLVSDLRHPGTRVIAASTAPVAPSPVLLLALISELPVVTADW